MPRKKKQKIEVNNNKSLQGLLQEVYNDACNQIKDAQSVVNEISNGSNPVDVDDWAKVSKAKTDALKLKDSGIKAKLDISKLQADLIKHNGDISQVVQNNPESVTSDSFAKIRELIEQKESKK